MQRIWTWIGLLILLTGCGQDPSVPRTAFYHWQTELELSPTEMDWLVATQTRKLYLKYFDLTVENGELVPTAKLRPHTALPDSVTVVPTLFLTNASMKQLRQEQAENSEAISQLVARCKQLIVALWPEQEYREIQFDCDWTVETRETFFDFLKAWRAVLPVEVELSATLRLHQYRYPKQTGIPPVDRVMLMYYNVGELDDWEEENSIFNLAAARAYLDAAPYPLPMDLALPLFRWGVLFREGKLIKLITNLDTDDLVDTSRFEPITIATADTMAGGDRRLRGAERARTRGQSGSPPERAKSGAPGHPASVAATVEAPKTSRYLVTKSTYLDGYYLYPGDLIRLEGMDAISLLAAAQQWQKWGGSTPEWITYYHLDETVLAPFTYQNLQDCANLWLAD